MSALTLVYSPILAGGGYLLCVRIGRYLEIKQSLAAKLYVWHTLFCFVYVWFVSTYGGDALGYFAKAQDWPITAAFGTRFVVSLTGILVQGFGFGLIDCFLFFNTIGAVALMIFAALLLAQSELCGRKAKNIAYLMLFLPSVSFWSSAIGKDAISFFSTCSVLFACLNFRRRYPLLLVGLAAMFLVRPHIAALQSVALLSAFVLSGGSHGVLRILGFVAVGGAMYILGPVAMEYAGLDDLRPDTVKEYQEQKSSHQFSGKGAVDISSMTFPGQVFTYLYRPSPLDASSVFSTVSALENLLLLYFTSLAIVRLKSVKVGPLSIASVYAIVLLAGGLLALAPATANMGIALRQKWMIVPALFFLVMKLVCVQNNKRA